MLDNIINILETVCPEKTFKFAKNRPSWLTNDLINLTKERDRSLKVYQKSKQENDKKEMRRLRNLVNLSVKNARADFGKDQLKTHKDDPKKFWKELNTLIPNSKTTLNQSFNNIKDENNKIISQDIVPNCVNSFFANIGLELDRKIPPSLQIGNNLNKKYDVEPFEHFDYITEDKLTKEMKNICIYKSSGLNI